VTASTQAADGMPLSDGLQWVETPAGDGLEESPDALIAAVREMAARLTVLRTAPILDEYNGPVLVEDEASAEIFSQYFGDALCAIRRPDVDNPQLQFALTMLASESPYQARIGSRILPDGYSVVDDATRESFDGKRLTGIQTFDDEGVPTPAVTLVERGVLKTLLSCRTPHKRISATNGHAAGTPSRPAFTNLFFQDSKGVNDAELRAKLMEQCKERGLAFGLRIARMMPSAVRSMETQESRVMMGMGGNQEGQKLSMPTAVYKVFADGHEELVRGVELSGVGTATFKEILLSGNRQFAYNALMNFKGMSSPFTGVVSKGISIIVPPVLFDELTAKKISGPFRTLPVVERPRIEN
jgi:TldD protein